MHYIYKKSTLEIVGRVYGRKTPEMETDAIQVEISNVIASELKGRKTDYAVVEGPIAPEKKRAEINSDGQVIFSDDPAYVLSLIHI